MAANPTTASPADQMRSRIRKYMVTVVGLLFGAFILLIVAAVVLKAVLEDATAAKVTAGMAPFVMLSVVVLSWVAVSRLWRCPACSKSVFMLISWNMSLFARAAARNCPHCSVELFPEAYQRRTSRFFVIFIILCVGGGALAGGLIAAGGRPRPAHPPTDVRPPPPPT